MTAKALLPVALSLAAAILLGGAIHTTGTTGPGALALADSGLWTARTILASYLLVQIDNYHHIWTYQGMDWRDDTEFMQQVWLVSKLRPDIAENYGDGGYHLAVNLGMVDEGLDLIRQGMRSCPDDIQLRWMYAIVAWQAAPDSTRLVQQACWDYLALTRRQGLDPGSNETNITRIVGWMFQSDPSRAGSERLGRLYTRRGDVCVIRIEALL